jgi:hypothetical protein
MDLQSATNNQMVSAPIQYELEMDEWYNLCRNRPDAFAHYYFKHILRSPSSEFHFMLYSLIKKINETEHPSNIAIAAPRGNAKTQIINMILPIWCAAFELKKFIVIMSETSRLAEANLESIKYELTSNDLLAEHFPHLVGEGKTWRKEVIDTCNDVRIIAVGSGKQVRGSQKKGGHRPDLVLCDDLSSDELVRTKKRRDDHEEWFRKAVMGMEGTADTKMDAIVTGTILHPHCLLSKLLDPKIFAGWESYKYKAVYKFSSSPHWKTWEHLYTNYEDEKREETAYKFFKAHEKEMLEDTKVLWPEGDSYYKLMIYKMKAGPRAFASEKQNNPIDPSQVLFNPEKIVYFDRKDIDLDKLIIYGAIDPASGDAKRKGDLSAIVTIGRDPKSGIIYVLDVLAASKGPSYCIKYISTIHQLYEYRKFGVDQDALKMLKDFIEKEVPDLRGKLVLYDLRIPKDKRINRLEPIVHSGLLRFQKIHQEMIEELTFYPNSEHDDALDALEIATRLTGHRGYRLFTY